MSKSRKLFERAKRVIPGGVNSPVRFYEPYPFFAAKAKGSRITEAARRSYIDYCMGYGGLFLGHNYRTVTNSVKMQLNRGSLFCTPTEKEVELAELMKSCIPCAEMVRLVNTGLEATMHAIRLARAFTKREKIIKFEGCYHGAHDYVLVGASSGSAPQGVPASEGTICGVVKKTLIVPYNDPDALEKVLERNEVAAVIVEPVMANMGLIPPENNFLRSIRKISQKNDILLIFDEVVTGFRLALGGAQEYFNVKPDIATFGKAISNGFPLAAIAGRRDIMENLAPSGKLYQASTFAGNPVSVTAALATIKILRNKKIYSATKRACEKLTRGIEDILSSLKFEATLNSIGSMFQIFFGHEHVRDYATAKKSNEKRYKNLFDLLLEEGVFVPPSQFETCFLSYSHTDSDLEQSLEGFERVLKKVA